jgi:hypothetical protein
LRFWPGHDDDDEQPLPLAALHDVDDAGADVEPPEAVGEQESAAVALVDDAR